MRLGIDFGTTRIVVAAVDRGNYPIIAFEGPDGQSAEWFPPLIAATPAGRLYGWDAWAAQADPRSTIIRSLKSSLENAGPNTVVRAGADALPMLELLTEMCRALRTALRERSTLQLAEREPAEIMLGVPANANSNQRFLTVEGFRQAGFEVLGLLNEPSAASIEFGHKNASKTVERILVYDLGGGTFDVSLVEMNERTHSVLASEGISTLGGDDFDELLADLALEAADVCEQDRASLTQAEWFRLHDECRAKKEALHPNTRKIAIELEAVREGWGTVTVPVVEYFEHCRPLIDETLHTTDDLLAAHSAGERIEALYVTGGGSELPLVGRMLRERFGKRVKRSAHTRTATAIGLAIQSDEQAGYVLREKFTRFFGVWREGDGGSRIVFDPLFPKGALLPAPGERKVEILRRYRPVHDIGHFRYLECSRTEGDRPTGDITVWDEILFPFDPLLKDEPDLSSLAVQRCGPAEMQTVEESYACDASGTVEVRIANLTSGYERAYRLGRWASKEAPVTPGKARRSSHRRLGRKSSRVE